MNEIPKQNRDSNSKNTLCTWHLRPSIFSSDYHFYYLYYSLLSMSSWTQYQDEAASVIGLQTHMAKWNKHIENFLLLLKLDNWYSVLSSNGFFFFNIQDTLITVGDGTKGKF